MSAQRQRDTRRGRPGEQQDDGRPQFEERVVDINRVAKVQKGGRRFSFTALVVVGDRAGRVGVGYGKAKEVPSAIQKAVEYAKRSMVPIPMIGATIPHAVLGEEGAGRVLLKPAAPGSGVIAGGPVRAVLECAGIEDCLAKILGTKNKINVVHATMAGLTSLRRPEEVARLRGKTVEQIVPPVVLRRMEMANQTSDGGAPVGRGGDAKREPAPAEPSAPAEAEPVAEPVAETQAAPEEPPPTEGASTEGGV